MKTTITLALLIMLMLAGIKNANAQSATALNFDGVDDYVTTAAGIPYDIFRNNGKMTIEAWVNANGPGSIMSSAGLFDLRVSESTGELTAAVAQSEGIVVALGAGTPFPLQSWHHVAVVADGVSIVLYIDGVNYGNVAYSGILADIPNQIYIGANDFFLQGEPENFLDGEIRDVRLWNRALCEAELDQHMHCGLSGGEPGLLANYKFNQGIIGADNSAVTTATDISSYHTDATLNNFGLVGHNSNWVDGQVVAASCGLVTGVNTYYKDTDGDGYGDPGAPYGACTVPAGYVSDNTDIDDHNDKIHFAIINDCPGDITVTAAAGSCGAVVNFGIPSAYDEGVAGLGDTTFNFTSSFQPWVVPAHVHTIDVDVAGCIGGHTIYNFGGLPGRVQTTMEVTPGETLYAYPGGPNGYPTGGLGGTAHEFELDFYFQGGYGGALSQLGRTGTVIGDTLVVAGGGGGAADVFGADLEYLWQRNGGSGGSVANANPGDPNFMKGLNGRQGGALSLNQADGGGGGGYRGGGNLTYGWGLGEGGSSHVAAAGTSNSLFTMGYTERSSYVRIKYVKQYDMVQTAGLPSGSEFPVGSTPVVFEYTNSDGVILKCSFNVTVNGELHTYFLDADGDGYGDAAHSTQACAAPSGYVTDNTDCNDADASVHPGTPEICGDGIDNNCDGQIDEGCSATYTYYFDGDGDGYGKTNSSITSNSSTPPPGYAKLDGDCNDGDPSVNPGKPEICGDGIDNNCDGQIDEGCSATYTYYFDGDGDGYGKTNSSITSNDPTPPPGYAKLDGDCNDGDPSVNPGKPEICGDGIDNNCDGQVDEGCSATYTYYFDGDGDGYGKTNSSIISNSSTPPPGYAKLDGDCNDGDPSVNPGKPEICGDGIDNNCDGQIDEGCSATYTYYFDGDGDGYGKTNSSITSNDPTPPPGYAKLDGDCNDGDPSVNPGKPEICGDGIDNNCDGNIDEGCSATYTYYFDGDGDGYGKTNSSITSNSSTPPPGYAKLDGDCNDGDPSVNPGKPEICGDGIDNNCDGQIDEGCSATYTYYGDYDSDGYGKTGNSITSNSPTPPPGYSAVGGDCNDGDPSVNPGKPEICGDGIDNNCDGQVDEGCSATYTYYGDYDNDGYGKTGNSITSNSPTPPPGYSAVGGDCNDGDPSVNPGKPEICGDGIDNNCDGQIDEGCSATYTYYGDYDGDGYGKTGNSITSNSSTPPPGYSAVGGDCNDGDPSVNPGKPEICGDGIDNNCDGQIDEGCSATYTYYFDGDGDGYGKTNSSITSNDPTPPPGYAKLDGDCNDGDPSVNPGKPEICGDGIDNNCDGQVDEGCSVTYTYYGDFDGDGYGKTGNSITSNDPTPPPGYSATGGDCNDGDPLVHPGAPEICGNGVDDNCDGQIDEGCSATYTYYFDGDGDGYGKTNSSITSNSSTPPPGYSAVGGDCNDGDPLVHPGAPEICGDGIDNNCNGQIDEGCVTYTYYFDGDGDGYGKTNSSITTTSSAPPPNYAVLNGDCNDGNASVHPGAVEICGNGIDDNCNGQIDEGCATTPSLSITDVSKKEGNKVSSNIVFTVTLNKAATKKVTVQFTTANGTATAGSDYAVTSGAVSFKPGTLSKKITVTIYGDKVNEPDETFKVTLSNAVNASITKAMGTGTILNDDAASFATAIRLEKTVSHESKAVKVYPNPVSSILNVKLSGYTGNVIVELLDLKGKVLRQEKLQTSEKFAEQKINVTALASGVYLLVVMDEKGNRQTEKVIVAK